MVEKKKKKKALEGLPLRFRKSLERAIGEREREVPSGTAKFFAAAGGRLTTKSKKKKCPSCGNLVDVNANFCPYCRYDFTPYGGKKKRCPKCGQMVGVNANFCPYCKYDFTTPPPGAFPWYAGLDKLGKVAGGRIRTNIFTIAILSIIGLLLILYGFYFLGSAVLVMIGYVVMPRNVTRGSFKLVVILLATLEFIFLHTQWFAALVVLWFGYFSMPTSYREGEPEEAYRASQAWGRFLLGFILAGVIYVAFGGIISPAPWLTSPQQFPILLMSLAFFAVMPYKETKSGLLTVVVAGRKVLPSDIGGRSASSIIFIGLMVLSLIFILNTWGIELTGGLGLTLIIFWFISLFIGLTAGRVGRPAAGVLMIAIALLVFTYQFTGVVGTQLFGPWWPQIFSVMSSLFEPATEVFAAGQQALEDTWLLITCPQCYYQQQQIREQELAGRIKIGGTAKSIELVNFEAINYATAMPEIDPTLPLIGTIELKNQGEFTADWVEVRLQDPEITNPKLVSAADPEKGRETLPDSDFCEFISCTGADEQYNGFCKWNSPSYPGDIKLMTFRCPAEADQWSKNYPGINSCLCYGKTGGLIAACGECYNETASKFCTGAYRYLDPIDIAGMTTSEALNKIKECGEQCLSCIATQSPDQCIGVCSPSGCIDIMIQEEVTCEYPERFVVYTKADWLLSLGFDYKFAYNVNVSTPVNVMNVTLFQQRLLNKEITLEEAESKYTGGPVQLSIWIQKQPLRDEETSFARISIVNTGAGIIQKDAELTIIIPTLYADIPKEVSKAKLTQISYPEGTKAEQESTYELKYILDRDLAKRQSATITLSFNYNIPDNIIEKSSLFIGNLNYQYSTEKEIDLPIMKGPITQ